MMFPTLQPPKSVICPTQCLPPPPYSSVLRMQAATLQSHRPYKHSIVVASLTSVGITNSSPLAIAQHADAEGPQAGSIPAVARGTPLAELAPVPRWALAALHPGSRDSSDGLRRHQGDIVDVAGAWREIRPVTRRGQQLHLQVPHTRDLHGLHVSLQCPQADGPEPRLCCPRCCHLAQSLHNLFCPSWGTF